MRLSNSGVSSSGGKGPLFGQSSVPLPVPSLRSGPPGSSFPAAGFHQVSTARVLRTLQRLLHLCDICNVTSISLLPVDNCLHHAMCCCSRCRRSPAAARWPAAACLVWRLRCRRGRPSGPRPSPQQPACRGPPSRRRAGLQAASVGCRPARQRWTLRRWRCLGATTLTAAPATSSAVLPVQPAPRLRPPASPMCIPTPCRTTTTPSARPVRCCRPSHVHPSRVHHSKTAYLAVLW